jgi:hypothetical protein
MQGLPRRTVGSLLVLGFVGCRVPAAIETPQASSAVADDSQEQAGEDEDEGDYEYEAPDVLPPSPNPAPPEESETWTGLGLGTGNNEGPGRVGVTTLSVEPDEYRSSLSPHSNSYDELLSCARRGSGGQPVSKGSMVIDYTIGSAARVTAVTVRSCDFPEAEICDCMGDVVAKWRFRPNVQLVDVSIQLDAYPPRRP